MENKFWSYHQNELRTSGLRRNNRIHGIKMLDPELIIPPPEFKDTW